jgi:hypothetical protein
MAAKTRRLGSLDTVGDVITALGKVARCMWNGELASADGHRLAGVLTMIRQSIESAQIEQLSARLDKLEGNDGSSAN